MLSRALPWALLSLALLAGCFCDDLHLYIPPEDAGADAVAEAGASDRTADTAPAPADTQDAAPTPDLASPDEATPLPPDAAPADHALDLMPADAPPADAGPADVAQD